MSLKAFHIVFVMISILLCLGFGLWAINEFRTDHDRVTLMVGIGSLLGCVVLGVYGRWFLKKLQGVSYL